MGVPPFLEISWNLPYLPVMIYHDLPHLSRKHRPMLPLVPQLQWRPHAPIARAPSSSCCGLDVWNFWIYPVEVGIFRGIQLCQAGDWTWFFSMKHRDLTVKKHGFGMIREYLKIVFWCFLIVFRVPNGDCFSGTCRLTRLTIGSWPLQWLVWCCV